MTDAAVACFVILHSLILYLPGYFAGRRKRKAALPAKVIAFPKRASSNLSDAGKPGADR